MDPGDVEYEPVSVVEVLAEMKDTAELLIDLSYSSVLLGSPEVAEEVLELEEQMDLLELRARMSLLLAARNPEDAERLAPVLGVVGAAEKIADAAGDIAKIVIEDIGMPDALRAALPAAVETLVRGTVAPESPFADRTLGDANMETETGVRVIAVRRAGEWLLTPDRETVLRPGDVVLLRGAEDHVTDVYELVTGERYVPPAVPEPAIDDLERAVRTIVLMKDVSELGVDLAYGAVLFDSEALAEEVAELEVEVDNHKSMLEAWALRAAGRVEDPTALRGLMQLASATEVISDAALELGEGVLWGIDAHPVVAAAVEESDEVIVRLAVAPDSPLAGRTLGEGGGVRTETGMRVIAVRRPGDEWVLSPGPDTRVDAGDVLIAKGTRGSADRLADVVGSDRSFD
jgi:uncharacterized protein with PhoU and TrkA domain